MLAVVRSELVRLSRPRLLAAWLGLTALVAVMINMIMFTVAGDSAGSDAPAGGPGVSFPDAAALADTGGIVAGVAAASSMFGVITLSFWAISTAGDSSSGLLRLLVSAEPHRWRLVLGKAIALSAVTAVAATVAVAVTTLAALPAARAADIPTGAWGTDLLAVVGEAWLNAFAALVVWGVIGLALAVLTRSAAIAVSAGVGYVLVVESVITLAAEDLAEWLPGSTLTAVAEGGNAVIGHGTALTLGLGYVVVGLAAATVVLTRRDIND